jgi:hypothetical protein
MAMLAPAFPGVGIVAAPSGRPSPVGVARSASVGLAFPCDILRIFVGGFQS